VCIVKEGGTYIYYCQSEGFVIPFIPHHFPVDLHNNVALVGQEIAAVMQQNCISPLHQQQATISK
jgi:hypothetical protein